MYNTENGVITSPGKFEGEAWYVPELWDLVLDGWADEDEDGIAVVYLSDEDRERFGLAEDVHSAFLSEDDCGFVTCVCA